MSEYWVSNAKYFCKYCKQWIADNKIQRQMHEQGTKHRENMLRVVDQMKEDNEKKREDERKLKEQLKEIEEAAEKAHYKDQNANAKGVYREQTYGDYDAYGGWYDGHGHYYTYKAGQWEYVGLFPQKDYVPGVSDAAVEAAVEPPAETKETAEEAEETYEAPQIGEWVEVKSSERTESRLTGQKRKIEVKIKETVEKRPGAEDSDDEDEARAAHDKGTNKEPSGSIKAHQVTFKKSKGKRKLRDKSNGS